MNPPKSRLTHLLICIGAFVAWFFSSFIILLMPNALLLLQSQYAIPAISLLLLLPCALVCWFFYQNSFKLMPIGKTNLNELKLPILAIFGLIFLNMLLGAQEEWLESISHITGFAFFLYVITIIIAAPISEEIIFRGFLLNAGMWYGTAGKWIAIIASSFLFASIHSQYQSVNTLITIFIMGAILCHVRISTRSLIAPILLHALNNMIATIFIFAMSF